jgi:hypothetical protein
MSTEIHVVTYQRTKIFNEDKSIQWLIISIFLPVKGNGDATHHSSSNITSQHNTITTQEQATIQQDRNVRIT